MSRQGGRAVGPRANAGKKAWWVRIGPPWAADSLFAAVTGCRRPETVRPHWRSSARANEPGSRVCCHDRIQLCGGRGRGWPWGVPPGAPCNAARVRIYVTPTPVCAHRDDRAEPAQPCPTGRSDAQGLCEFAAVQFTFYRPGSCDRHRYLGTRRHRSPAPDWSAAMDPAAAHRYSGPPLVTSVPPACSGGELGRQECRPNRGMGGRRPLWARCRRGRAAGSGRAF